MKKIIIFALCLLIFTAPVLSSCGDKADGGVKTNDASGEAPQEEATGDPNARENISDDLEEADYNEYNFRIYTYGENAKYVLAEEEGGEVISDSIYNSNREVEARFNVKITEVNSGGDDVSHVTNIKKLINTGDDAFDIAFGHDSQLGSASLEGYFYNVCEVPNINLSKPWWPEHTVNSLKINDQMYVFSNAISYLGMQWTRVLFINKDKAKDMGIEIPYQEVFDGKWTVDRMIEITKEVYTDVNGDGNKDKNDFYGYVYSGGFYCSVEPFGIEPIVKDPDTILKLNVDNDRTLTAIDKMYSLLFESNGAHYDSDYESKNNMFMADSALFIYTELGNAVDKFRFTDINYGILPMGKLDGNQEKYYAGYTDKLFVIPNNPPNIERTGTIVEAMSALGYKKVFPAYYETALKNKYLQDEESIEVLDLINASRVLDFGYIYGCKYSMMFNDLFNTAKPNTNFASYYEKSVAAEQKKLDKLIEAFEKMQG